MVPGNIYEFEINLGNVAICFDEGHRVRIGISSALSSRYEANPNTGEPFRENTYTQIAHNKIYSDPLYPSRVILPVLPDYPSPVTERISKLPESISIKTSPNPFNAAVEIEITVTDRSGLPSFATDIFDIRGKFIRKLDFVTNGGVSTAIWDALDETGSRVPAGVYLIRYRSRGKTSFSRTVFIP